jgi:hypothetical protein
MNEREILRTRAWNLVRIKNSMAFPGGLQRARKQLELPRSTERRYVLETIELRLKLIEAAIWNLTASRRDGMGNYAIIIEGVGVHHNDGSDNDADALAGEFVDILKSAGHQIRNASFTYGGAQYSLPIATAEIPFTRSSAGAPSIIHRMDASLHVAPVASQPDPTPIPVTEVPGTITQPAPTPVPIVDNPPDDASGDAIVEKQPGLPVETPDKGDPMEGGPGSLPTAQNIDAEA